MSIDSAARNIEARENTWSLSTSADERGSLSVPQVVAAFEECVSILRERVRSMGYAGQVTFYVWHDRQAGQLKCSTTIAEKFFYDAHPGQVSWDDLRPVSDGDAGETQPGDVVVRVWTADQRSAAGGPYPASVLDARERFVGFGPLRIWIERTGDPELPAVLMAMG